MTQGFNKGFGRFLAETIESRASVVEKTNEELQAALTTGADLFLYFPDRTDADKIAGNMGSLGSWSNGSVAIPPVSAAPWAQGNGTSGGYRATNTSPQVVAGGGDYVYRTMLVWADGTLGSTVRLFGNSTPSGSINVLGFVYFTDNDTVNFLQQHGSKVNSVASFTLPDTLEDGDVVLLTFGQEDNGDGTQRVSCWVNGEACAVASVSGATDNGDGTVDVTDGTVNGTTSWCWLCVLSSLATESFGRFMQLAATTTDTNTEARIARTLLGALGRLPLTT